MTSLPLRRRRRKACCCTPDLFDHARQVDLLTTPAVRAIQRRAGVSPALALALAELSGLSREARGD
jgi:hypothetical protein